MNIKGLVLALAAGLSISTAAQAGVTIHNSDFLGATGNSNGFEAIGGAFYNGSAGYTEGGVKVQYFGRDLTTLTTLNPVGKHSWTPLFAGAGYTAISLADGGDFSAIEFLAGGSNWFGNASLQYQLVQNGAVVFSGLVNGLGDIGSSLKTIGFSGTDGQLFDELRVQSVWGDTFNPHGYDQLILDNITIAGALSSAVPEPATWAMMIIGFGAVGSMVRTARRRQAYAFA